MQNDCTSYYLFDEQALCNLVHMSFRATHQRVRSTGFGANGKSFINPCNNQINAKSSNSNAATNVVIDDNISEVMSSATAFNPVTQPDMKPLKTCESTSFSGPPNPTILSSGHKTNRKLVRKQDQHEDCKSPRTRSLSPVYRLSSSNTVSKRTRNIGAAKPLRSKSTSPIKERLTSGYPIHSGNDRVWNNNFTRFNNSNDEREQFIQRVILNKKKLLAIYSTPRLLATHSKELSVSQKPLSRGASEVTACKSSPSSLPSTLSSSTDKASTVRSNGIHRRTSPKINNGTRYCDESTSFGSKDAFISEEIKRLMKRKKAAMISSGSENRTAITRKPNGKIESQDFSCLNKVRTISSNGRAHSQKISTLEETILVLQEQVFVE